MQLVASPPHRHDLRETGPCTALIDIWNSKIQNASRACDTLLFSKLTFWLPNGIAYKQTPGLKGIPDSGLSIKSR